MSEVEEGEPIEYHVRRQRRSTITIIVILLALAGAFYYASTYFRESTPKPSACTTETAAPQLRPRDVTVNVYNATARKGLALSTSKVVAQRGFKIAAVANDPAKKAIKQVAQIRYGPDGEDPAKLLASHLPGSVLVKDKRKGETIDLALGNAYKALGPVPKASTSAGLRLCGPDETPAS